MEAEFGLNPAMEDGGRDVILSEAVAPDVLSAKKRWGVGFFPFSRSSFVCTEIPVQQISLHKGAEGRSWQTAGMWSCYTIDPCLM